MQMDLNTKGRLKEIVIAIEGCRNKAYHDIYGNITIGIGHNLSSNAVSDDIINEWFDQDVDYFFDCLSNNFPWFGKLDEDRRMALTYMAFNLGWARFMGFRKMLAALSHFDYETAAQEILDSKYYTQVPRGADTIYEAIKNGNFEAPE